MTGAPKQRPGPTIRMANLLLLLALQDQGEVNLNVSIMTPVQNHNQKHENADGNPKLF